MIKNLSKLLVVLLLSFPSFAQEKVSSLPLATSISDTDWLYLVTSSPVISKKVTVLTTKQKTYAGVSGAGTINPSGVLAISTSAITNSNLAGAIDAVKIANGSVSNTEYQYLDGTTSNIQAQINAIASGGTVTSASVVTANGFSGTVATATTTPAITLHTTITGLLKGNGSAISAGASGVDYAPATPGGTAILKANGSGGFANAVVGTDYLGPTSNGSGLTNLTAANITSGTAAINIGGNAATATALAANPTNCSAGNYPLGIDASGNVESCTAASGSPGGSNTQVQYNNSGAFGGITGATTNGTALTLTGPSSNNLNLTGATIPTNGVYLPSSGTVGVSVGGGFKGAEFYAEDASPTAYWKIGAGTTADAIKGHVFMRAHSTAYASTTMRFQTEGPIGQFHVYQDDFIHFNVGDTFAGGEVHNGYVNVTGAHDGGNATISVQRDNSGLHPGLTVYTAGHGNIEFLSDNIAQNLLKLNYVSGGVNWPEINPGTTGNGFEIAAHGEANVDVVLTPKGTGKTKSPVFEPTGAQTPTDVGMYRSSANNLALAANGVRQVRVTGSSSAVNYVQLQGSTTGNDVSVFAGGSDTDIGLVLASAGVDDVSIRTNGGNNVGLNILNVASSVNHPTIAPSATGTNSQLTITGTDSNSGLNIVPNGTGGVGIGFTGAITGRFHVKQSTGGTAIATFRDDSNAADLTVVSSASNVLKLLTGTSDSLVLATAGGSAITIDSSGNTTIAGALGLVHIDGTTSAPTIAAGAGAGTSPTVAVSTNSTDIAGSLDITTGTVPTGTNAVIATVTFNVAYGTAPFCTVYPANATTATLSGVSMVFITSTTTTMVITSGTSALTGSTAYKWNYNCIQ